MLIGVWRERRRGGVFVDEAADLEDHDALQGVLGYLNFSTGKPDGRFQTQISSLYGALAGRGVAHPWSALRKLLADRLRRLVAEGIGGFRDVSQVEAIVALVFDRVLPAYRKHHGELLFHQSDRALFQPFFVARTFETVLGQGGPWNEHDRIVKGTLKRLNDFVGHRPIAILETRSRAEPYSHERVRPIPLFIRGAGVASGRYAGLVEKALEILAQTPASILQDASFDLNLLDELALDPRAYDHGHPVNRRPNYVFGEWDPHHLDGQGRYRRYVARQITLDALLERVETPGALAPDEVLLEAAAVLAGTLLMATGISGAGPETHDSGATLAKLMPGIARYRDAFYNQALARIAEPHRTRLQQEQRVTRQAFGGARQHLNQVLARQRAERLQNRHLAAIFAVMGYAAASRKQASLLPAASARLMTEIQIRLTSGQLLLDRGDLAGAAPLAGEVKEVLKRGIACGALADPWNILGFQGQFPLFTAMEDSVRDPRIDELVAVVEQLLAFQARLMGEAAARGELTLIGTARKEMKRVAAWWDRFASVEVSGIRRVHGEEASTSAEHVAQALLLWHDRGEASADIAFWRDQLDGFQAPKAFALVIDALLRKDDYWAAMALLINWVGQAERVPLEEGDFSFHTLALRWMLGVSTKAPQDKAWALKKKMFEYLEANAEDLWQVPALTSSDAEELDMPAEGEEDPYRAAYEDVTFQDSAADGEEGEVLEGGNRQEFDLEAEGEGLVNRLRFLATVARLWQVGSFRGPARGTSEPRRGEDTEILRGWLTAAQSKRLALLDLMDDLEQHPVPEPEGDHDSLVDYDRHRLMKEQLVSAALATCLETTMAVGVIRGLADEDPVAASTIPDLPPWDAPALLLERALLRGEADQARLHLAEMAKQLRGEPLLFRPLEDGGHPRQVLQASLVQNVLRGLLHSLPRLGLFRETYQLLRLARTMEQNPPPEGAATGRRISVFDQLFQIALQSIIELVVDSAHAWDQDVPEGEPLGNLLDGIVEPFVRLWEEQSQTMQLSALEGVRGEEEWSGIQNFIRRYGSDLFHARFMTLGNLRGILHRGVGAYFNYLADNPDPLHPVRLLEDLERAIPRKAAEHYMTCILATLVENYEEYKDYNTTTPQSDYGENLHALLDFLALKAAYDRQSWLLRPLVLVHEVLVRRNQWETATLWQAEFVRLTQAASERHLEELVRLEREHGMRLRTLADRIGERFVKPLALDRLCALVGPAMAEAREQRVPEAFARFERELPPYTAEPAGVGLDVPPWLRRLETEVDRVRVSQGAVAGLAERLVQVPTILVSREDLEHQLRDWEKPLDG
jgi:hypothetical protein